MNMEANIAGVVLAGGRSSRMGRNKALLDYKGTRLLDHMQDILRWAGLKTVYVSGDFKGYDCIPDKSEFSGPAAAIRNVMAEIEKKGHSGALFVPVDMPFLIPDILIPLIVADRGAHYQNWPLPLFLSVAETLADGKAVKEMIAKMTVQTLSFPPSYEDRFANLNTPQDWREAVEI